MIKEQFLEPFAIRRVCVKGRRITFHQLFARRIAGNAQESVVEVQKVSLRSRDEHAFLNVRNQCAVFFFRPFAIRNVLQDVHCAHLAARRICEHRVRRQEIAGQPGIGIVSFARNALAIGTLFVLRVLLRK